MDKVIEQLKELRNVRPDRDWVASHRELLLSQITSQATAKPQSVVVNSWFLAKSLMPTSVLKFLARPVGVITAVFLVVFGSGIFGVSASRNSVPGDLLYNVKLTGEKMKVSISNTREQVKLHAEFAAERVKEIEKLVVSENNNNEEKKAKIIVAVNGLENEMKQAQSKLEDAKEDNKDSVVVEIAKQVDAKTAEISESINKNKEQLNELELQKTLIKAQATVEATSVKAIEVIIEKKNKGVPGIDEKALLQSLDQKITNAKEIVKQTEETTKPVETTTVEVSEKTAEVATVETTNIKPIEINIIDSKAAEKTITEAKELLNNGDLTQAIQKVAETAVITTQVIENQETETTVVEPVTSN